MESLGKKASPRVTLSDGRCLAYSELGVPKHKSNYKIIIVHGFGRSKEMTFLAPQVVNDLTFSPAKKKTFDVPSKMDYWIIRTLWETHKAKSYFAFVPQRTSGMGGWWNCTHTRGWMQIRNYPYPSIHLLFLLSSSYQS